MYMNNKYEELKKQFEGRIKEHELLAPYTTYKVGGPADLFFTAATGDELVSIVIAARKLGIPLFVLGGGSNILVGDKGFRGLVIKNNSSGITIKGMKGKVQGSNKESLVYLEVDSGVPMNKLVRFTIEEGLSGLEMHLGLPGSVGGAIYMNSKWTKPMGNVGDTVYQAVILTKDNQPKQVDKNYFNFSYGTSSLQKSDDTLIRVVFILKKDNTDVLWNRANESIAYRRESQPQGVHTAGCIFKNITPAEALTFGTPDHQTSAGYLLDKAGCKSMKVGGAEVSMLHANFVITHPGATASHVVELIDTMKKNVKKKFGVRLKEEILRIGEFV
jgi:UDP-N-acetylmuramate dehydrogenase